MDRPDTPKLRDYIEKYYRIAHQQQLFTGITYKNYLPLLEKTVPEIRNLSILDYGCGHLGGLGTIYKGAVSYDPFIPKYNFNPWKSEYDVIFSADVMEHMTVPMLSTFLKLCNGSCSKYLFFAISLKWSDKRLENGTSIHLTVETPSWWRGFFQGRLQNYFEIILAQHDLITETFMICMKKNNES